MRHLASLPESRGQPQQPRQRGLVRAESQQRAHECEQQSRVAAGALELARSYELTGSHPEPSNGCMILARVAKKNQPAACGTAAEARRRRPNSTTQGKVVRAHGYLFDRYANFDALHDGYLQARKGCRDSRACMRFELRLEENLIDLLNHMHWGSYRTGPYRHFYVHEPKTRRITALTQFRDRVAQHALYAVLEPIWERRFVSDSYACRVGKGTHRAADAAQQMLRECLRAHGRIYVLKADIRKYFASIDHYHAKRLIRRAVKCPRTLALLDEMIDSYSEPGQPGKGMPIGNLISQLLANVYLNELDQYVKCRLGERWYCRYMDDFLIIGPDKQHLHRLRIHLEWWLAEHLDLETNHKTGVFPVHPREGRGLDFVGFHMWPHKRRLRKGSMKRFKRRVRRLRRQYAAGEITAREIQLQLNSWLAHASHANAEGFVRSVIYDTPWEKDYAAVRDKPPRKRGRTGAQLSECPDHGSRRRAAMA